MGQPGSVTCNINHCKAGNPEAALPLWERYYRRLVALAERELRGKRWAVFDEEDVALSALDSFFCGMAGGRYPELGGRDQLWALLRTIVQHKIMDRVKHAQRGKRDLRRQGRLPEERFEGREPDPALAVLAADECRRLLDRLGDDRLREVALLKLEGYTDKQIATQLDCGLRTVERKLERIRCIWAKEIR
jgi:DNA-directed RNA polymerase specialized sigma24 family protein